jgi:hypothetical protein
VAPGCATALLPFFGFNDWFVYEVVILIGWPELLDGARFRIERGDAGVEPVGVAGDGAGDKCTVTLTREMR